jgi:hypothetical protein
VEKKPEPPKPAEAAKPAEPAAPPAKPDEVDEYLNLSDEEQEKKLSSLSKTDAHKLARKAFARAGRMLQEKGTLEQKLKEAEKSAQSVLDLQAKVEKLENSPETKAQQAALQKAQTDLKAAEEAFAADREKVEKDKKYVEGLQMAHDVKKTPKWKQYVSDPSVELLNDIKMIAAGASEDEGEQNQVAQAIIYALNQPDEASRWRALKQAGAQLDPGDQTLLADIFKGHTRIEKNKAFLTGQSEEARKALDEGREREQKEKKDARSKEYNDGLALARENFEKELPWIREDFDMSKYPEPFQKTILDTREFAKRIEATELTPAQEAKVKQGFAFFQGAAILARNYAKALEVENETVRAKLKEFTDKEEAAAAVEAEKEKNKGELTPSAAPKKVPPTKVSNPPAVPQGGSVRSVGSAFAALVAKGQ